MTPSDPSPSSILVDVELPAPVPLPPKLVAALASLRVVLVGWYAVPEQTSPAQARDQFGAEAQAALDTVARRFAEAGATGTTSRLVFTGSKFDTLTRISTEEDCDAVLIPGALERLRRLLVPLRGLQNAGPIVPFVADLVQDGETTNVTLLHVLQEEETEAGVQADLFGPIVEQLAAQGVETDLVERRVVTTDDPADTIVEVAAHYDLVVLGETQPSVRSVLFGTVPERIVQTVDLPVVVMRHEEDDVTMAERAAQPDAH
jgi:nucleotide-binding universal stress UspA family protein